MNEPTWEEFFGEPWSEEGQLRIACRILIEAFPLPPLPESLPLSAPRWMLDIWGAL